jgi:ubiquinone/menaquinone biosynthesis C-methylase UbiE
LKQLPFEQRETVTEFFDKTAGDYSQWYSNNSWLGYAFCIRKSRVLELFDQPGAKILDVGCGPGVMAADLLERDCDFWGMDVSKEMIRQGQEKYGSHDRIHFSTGTADNLDFPDNTFDAVISMGVIEFVDNDQLALQEMTRVLKEDGTLIVAFINKYSPFRLWRDYMFYPLTAPFRQIFYRFVKRPRKPHINQRTYSERSIRDVFTQNKCDIKDIVYCNFNIFISPLEHIFPRLSTLVSQKLERFCRSRLKMLGTCFIVKASKR